MRWFLTIALLGVLADVALSRDLDGRFAQSPLKPWFDQLRSSKGLCCWITDGFSISDVDWTIENGRYRVRLYGKWMDVPDEALVTEPNRYGPPMVWPITIANGAVGIRCFMPGALT
jgi:hypothetical protein